MVRSLAIEKVAKLALDFIVLSGAFCLAFLLRFEGILPLSVVADLLLALPAVLAVKVFCLLAFGVRRLSWRHVSLLEAQRIAASLAVASAVLLALRLLFNNGTLPYLSRSAYGLIPIGVLLIDLPLSVVGFIGLRVAARRWTERRPRRERSGPAGAAVPTLLIGADFAAATVAREVTSRPELGLRLLGFVADGAEKRGKLIHGLPILGGLNDLPRLVANGGAQQALITSRGAGPEAVRRIADLCARSGIAAKIVPDLEEVLRGRLGASAIREVRIEDLLGRPPVSLDLEAIAANIQGRTVLVSGAGGSIGSEICRTVCRFGPAKVVLVEQAENSLFHIHRELTAAFPELAVVPCIADVCDLARLEQIFQSELPDVVFHAAAHKHVPMMEWNPAEAIKNNVCGTRNLANMADEYGVSEFVMISTDKAVNPSSVMGVSKRVAELYVQALSQRSRTRFVAVRFGNVLGSAGSVIPIFQEQIARGGPVTVTHPEMTRYFMTIPEACQLVLQAASMGQGGEIFILDMGEPVKIVDLARDLILLSGLQPGKDIEIRFSGMRPGEKLYEELSLAGEAPGKTRHPRIFIGRLRAGTWEWINNQIEELRELADSTDPHAIRGKFKEIVPEYLYEAAKSKSEEPVAAARVDRSQPNPYPGPHRNERVSV